MEKKQDSSTGDKFQRLVHIMAQLRGEDGCPWDREQTHRSLRQYLLEEAFEVLEAIDDNNVSELPKELGDLLLQIVFHAQIATEDGRFSIDDVIEGITNKLINRHPNVFGDVNIETAEEQSINWEKMKRKEGKKSVIDGVPRALSALLRATRIQQKAATVGFDWPNEKPVWDKIDEEIQEFKQACQQADSARMEEEFGDVLFSLVNLARFLNINGEDALRQTTEKFIRRFQKLEADVEAQEKNMHDMSLEELDAIWNKVKRQEKPDN